MKSLRIEKAKPNPKGKDRTASYVPPAQLAAEWIDFANDGTEDFVLVAVSVQHVAYGFACKDGKWQEVATLNMTLKRGQIVRIHSGNRIPMAEMNAEDFIGADIHLFTGKNYTWNNDCGDFAGLWSGNSWIDQASYAAHPPEGRILRRLGNQLVP